MGEKQTQHLEKLAELLVTPERFGQLALPGEVELTPVIQGVGLPERPHRPRAV